MCGITGVVAKGDVEKLHHQLSAMTKAIAHRGPDGQGISEPVNALCGSTVILGHRRLSIVDLAGGHQPMIDEPLKLHLTFNGEIYNYEPLRAELIALGHTFSTVSDTEVVLRAYAEFGERCLEKFNGMFALALWDEDKQRLFIARDRFGKKPFFYMHEERSSFLFSSEIKSFKTLESKQLTINKTALWNCALLRYHPGENCLYNEIKELPPGSYGYYDPTLGDLIIKRYYVLQDSLTRQVSKPTINSNSNSNSNSNTQYPTAQSVKLSRQEAVAEFLPLFRNAVEIRTNCDVPFGAFLSGGIDSAAVVAVMSDCLDQPVKTFSAGFKQKEYSELSAAALVSDTYKTDHQECIIEPDDVVALLPEAIHYRDGPVSEPSDIPILMLSRLASESVKMVLTGEGSDEILGGYPKHVFERYAAVTQKLPSFAKKAAHKSVQRSLPYKYGKLKIASASLFADDYANRMQTWFGSMTPTVRENIFNEQFINDLDSSQLPNIEATSDSSLRNILSFDQQFWLPGNLLERGDRMTMAASIEARMPFLDYRIAEFVSSLPDHYRVQGFKTKVLLRESVAQLLPESIINRKKVGFKVPIALWFRTTLDEYLHENLLGQSSILREYVNRPYLEDTLKEHRHEKQNHEKLLWSLLNLELWLKQAYEA